MDNKNNNKIIDELKGWPRDVYGFLRGARSNGLNLWVTFVLVDKVGLYDTNDEKRCRFSDTRDKEQIKMTEEQNVVHDAGKGMNDDEEEEMEDYNPYIRLYTDCEDWGYGDGMPKAWRK